MCKMNRKFCFACSLLCFCLSFFTVQACNGMLDQVPEGSLKVIWGYKGEVFGPISGGTLILLHAPGGGLDDLIDDGVNLVLKSNDGDEKVCTLSEQVLRNDTFQPFLSAAGSDPDIEKEFSIQLKCPNDEKYFDLNKPFSYKPNPSVDASTTDLKTIVSGGIEMTFQGTNMLSVGFPVMMMYLEYKDKYGQEEQRGCYYHDQSIWCKQICRLRNDTEFYCISPNMYYNLPPHLHGGYAGGGQGASYSGWAVDFSTAPDLEISLDEISTYMSFIISTNNSYDDETGNGRRKRQTAVWTDPAILDVDASVRLLLGSESEDFQLKIAEDPTFDTYDVKKFNPEFHKNEDTLKITGTYLDSGANQRDFFVTIGGVECPLIGPPVRNAIICKPPEKPENPTGPTKDGGLEIVVNVGYLPVSIGFLKYIAWYQSSVFIGIVVTVIAVPLFLVAVYFLITKWFLQTFYPKEYPFVVPSVHSNVYDVDVLTKIGADLGRRVRESGLLLPEHVKIRIVDRIGSGNFGVVYEGFLQDGNGDYETHVAVKTLKEYRSLDDEQVKGVFEEALMMSQFDHQNIVKIIGITILRNQPHIIMPLMRKKDLRSHLRKTSNKFTVKELVGYGVQIASGMAHMESKGVVHRDLAARNCMVSDDEMNIKVSDFGLARETNYRDYYQQTNKSGGLPVRWMAPESLNYYRFTSKSDVWSFGVVLWELLSRGGHPYADYADRDILRRLNIDIRLPKPPMCPTEIYNIMQKCWASEPEDRPNFAQVVVMMREVVVNQEPEYADTAVYAPGSEYEGKPEYDYTRASYSYLYMLPVQPNGKAPRDSVPPERAPVPPKVNNQFNVKYHP